MIIQLTGYGPQNILFNVKDMAIVDPELIELARNFNQDTKVCRECNCRLDIKATCCRKKHCKAGLKKLRLKKQLK